MQNWRHVDSLFNIGVCHVCPPTLPTNRTMFNYWAPCTETYLKRKTKQNNKGSSVRQSSNGYYLSLHYLFTLKLPSATAPFAKKRGECPAFRIMQNLKIHRQALFVSKNAVLCSVFRRQIPYLSKLTANGKLILSTHCRWGMRPPQVSRKSWAVNNRLSSEMETTSGSQAILKPRGKTVFSFLLRDLKWRDVAH